MGITFAIGSNLKQFSDANIIVKLILTSILVIIFGLVRILAWNFYSIFLGFGPFYLAVMLPALWGGFFLGIFATFFSCLFLYYSSFAEPVYIDEHTSIVTLIYFCVNGAIFSLVGEYFRLARKKMRAALSNAKRLSDALDYIPVYVYMKDLNHRYIYANKPTLSLFKCSESELANLDDNHFFPEATVKRLHEIDNRVFYQQITTQEEIHSTDSDGHPRVFWEVKTPLYEEGNDHKIYGLCGISTDITERKVREDVLRESEERFHSVFEAAAIGMAIVDIDGRFVQVNKGLCQLVGYTSEELSKKTFIDITHPDDLQTDLEYVKKLLDGTLSSYQLEKRYYHKDGHIIWILLTGSVVHDTNQKVKYFIAQIMDITQQKSLVAKLEQHANQDALTGLNNRRYFIEQGELEFKRARRMKYNIAILMVDIDYFKKVNDMHGHKIGDLVLQHFSTLLRRDLRSTDLVGRIGGEEFAIILPNVSEKNTLEAAEKLRSLAENNHLDMPSGQKINYTISIGAYISNVTHSTVEEFLDEADKALYQAKNSGRNRVCSIVGRLR
ncbi:Stalked cell differentiation-controlling protein [Fluoribacter dumoffii]|uniref:Stalked cell differentiation-controlling protein n=1 Tax=Fluoribacter dumoffii TaxID=463 RepID=A0A377G7W8_9GAMM|nr:sensory box/GGDEF family protein [Fluoribacter dumoffii NY 23]STO20912.1 Stalked cell differentiation-controlling protein [Fluoribacter dumoffii]